MESTASGWLENNGGPTGDVVIRLAILDMKLQCGGKITHLMERTKFRISKKHWKRFNRIITERKRRFWKFLENCKRLIRMRRSIGTKKVEICGTHVET